MSSKINQFRPEFDYYLEPEYAGLTKSWLIQSATTLTLIAIANLFTKTKPAIKIQSFIRGWKVREKIHLWNKSASKIQKTWRGYLGRLRYFSILHKTMVIRLEQHYQKSAITIQSSFRGYYSRKYNHDHCKLKRLRLKACKDLLLCVALTSREILKKQELPGLYPLANSRCFTKIEKLMKTLNIKKYNEEVRRERHAEVVELTRAFHKSMRSRQRTELPFGDICHRKKPTTDYDKYVSRTIRISGDTVPLISDLSFTYFKSRPSSRISYKP